MAKQSKTKELLEFLLECRVENPQSQKLPVGSTYCHKGLKISMALYRILGSEAGETVLKRHITLNLADQLKTTEDTQYIFADSTWKV